MTAGVSEAIVAYLGWGRSPFPLADKEAILSSTPCGEGEAVADEVAALVVDFMSHEPDWGNASLVEAADNAKEEFRIAHPEVSQEALDALVWKFTYEWR